jgi:pSer/pThr/pTyr-binding forkhead associated (FHA) protein
MEYRSSASPLGNSVFLIINRQIIPLDRPITRIGRQLDNDIVLNEEYVSRLHAEIRFENGKYVLYDQESTGGTFVNSRKVDRCILNSGDVISVANIQIMFVNNNPRLAGKSTLTTKSLNASELPVEDDKNLYGTRTENSHH